MKFYRRVERHDEAGFNVLLARGVWAWNPCFLPENSEIEPHEVTIE